MAYISGTIFDASGHQPLQGVGVYAESSQTITYGEAVSNSEGFYRIDPVDPGSDYFITTVAERHSYRVFQDLTVPPQGLGQDIALVRTGAIRGSVTALGLGEPVSGANMPIFFSQIDSPSLGNDVAQTDASGNFYIDTLDVWSLANASGSNYRILVAPEQDFSYALSDHFIATHYNDDDIAHVRYEVRPRGILSGTITSGGAPLAGATVQIYENLSGLLLDDNPVQTDANGYFEMRVNAPADYRVVAYGPGTSQADVIASVASGQRTSLPVDLAPPGKIVGTVTDFQDSPVSGVKVELRTLDEASILDGPVVTGSDGAYTFSELPPDQQYFVGITMPTAQEYTRYPFASGVLVSAGQTTLVNFQGDNTRPTGRITSFASSQETVSGDVLVTVEANDNEGVYDVDLSIDDQLIQTIQVSDIEAGNIVRQATVSFNWSSTSVGNGAHVLVVSICDLAGNLLRLTTYITVRNSV